MQYVIYETSDTNNGVDIAKTISSCEKEMQCIDRVGLADFKNGSDDDSREYYHADKNDDWDGDYNQI